MATIKHTMWYYVGLVRSRAAPGARAARPEQPAPGYRAFYRTTQLDPGIISLRNAVLAALIVAQAAWENRESHGCHYRID